VICRQDEAFVLDSRGLGESDLIVTLWTENHGRVRAVARAGRGSRRRFGGLLEPMTRVSATWSEREGRELHRLDGLEGRHSFAPMQADPLVQAACAVLADLAAVFTREGQADGPGFRLLGAVLEALEAGRSPWVMLRYFEYWTLRLHGLLPDLEACAVCGRSLAAGAPIRLGSRRGPLCAGCPLLPHERQALLGPVDREFMDALRRLPPAELTRAWRREVGPAIEILLRSTLETFAEKRFHTYRHFRVAESPPVEDEE
jgi:DNA repair protein RecO (recombination protein O)